MWPLLYTLGSRGSESDDPLSRVIQAALKSALEDPKYVSLLQDLVRSELDKGTPKAVSKAVDDSLKKYETWDFLTPIVKQVTHAWVEKNAQVLEEAVNQAALRLIKDTNFVNTYIQQAVDGYFSKCAPRAVAKAAKRATTKKRAKRPTKK